jgi:hypothetical protein
MPIAYSTIEKLLISSLDAEGSQRYLPDTDFIPAINYAIDYVTLAFNSIFAEKKLSEEVLKELTFVKVWMASTHSRIAFDSTLVGMDLWSILAVYPKCKTTHPFIYTPPTVSQESNYLPLESYTDGDYSAKRLTLEEWTERNHNVFSAGYNSNCPDLVQYGWVNFANYTGGYTLVNNKLEIEVAPNVSGERVAIAFLKKPNKIALITDSIEFPDTLLTVIVNCCLRFISVKQGGKVSLFEVSELEKKNLISLLS